MTFEEGQQFAELGIVGLEDSRIFAKKLKASPELNMLWNVYKAYKQRVREAIDKVIPIDELDAQSVILNTELKKELGL